MIYTEGFRRAQELGVRLLQDAEVIGATLRGGRIIALETTRGPIEGALSVGPSEPSGTSQ